MDVEKKIKAYLVGQGISQKDFAVMIRMHPAKLNHSLNGKRRFTFVEYENICFILGVEVSEFLEPRKPKNKRVV